MEEDGDQPQSVRPGDVALQVVADHDHPAVLPLIDPQHVERGSEDAGIGLVDGCDAGCGPDDLRDRQGLEQIEQTVLAQDVWRRLRPRVGDDRQAMAGSLEAPQRVGHAGDQLGSQGRALGVLDLGTLVHDGVAEIE